MSTRLALCVLGAAVIAVPAVTVRAAPPPAAFCGWIRDAAQDATVESLAPTGLDRGSYSDPSLDVLSADIGTTRNGLRIVIRLADLRPPTLLDTYGQDFATVLTIVERRYVVRVVLVPGADRPEATVEAGAGDTIGTGGPPPQPAGATLDVRRDEIRVDAPFSSFRRIGPVSVGDDVHDGTVLSGRFARPEYPVVGAPAGYVSVDADRAVAGTWYRIGRPSCA